MTSVKLLHITCAVLSLAGFTLRGLWMLADSPRLRQRWVRIAPHIVDTLLLISALVLAVQMHLAPLQHPWLMAKIIALLLYIGFGTIALKRGKSKGVRGLAWVIAVLIFGYIVAAALSKSALGYLALV